MTNELSSSRALVRAAAAAVLGGTLGLVGCNDPRGGVGDDTQEEEDTEEADLPFLGISLGNSALKEGKRLFDKETFGGNGRTCLTCHSKNTGTLSPEDVEEIFDCDPGNPLFLHDGSDDFLGNGSTRILEDATILGRVKLPANVKLASNPTATSIIVRRGIPSTLNTPALDPVLMLDGRGSSLTGQANGAIRGHAQAPDAPAQEDLDLIVLFETKSSRFFSSDELQDYAEGGDEPELPNAWSQAAKRGKKWFEDAPVGPSLNQGSSRKGLCALCHSGPMLNQTNSFLAALPAPFGAPAGTRFQSVLVSELNAAQHPEHNLLIQNPDGTTTAVSTPDPGRAFINGTYQITPFGLHTPWKIPSLWAVEKTAPYFHDNSAKTLAAAVEHYATFFAIVTAEDVDGDPPLVMTAQDKADLVAFLKLL